MHVVTMCTPSNLASLYFFLSSEHPHPAHLASVHTAIFCPATLQLSKAVATVNILSLQKVPCGRQTTALCKLF